MKRQLVILTLFLISIVPVYAGHISGGEVYYKYIGPGTTPNTDQFTITLRLFRDCNATGTMVAPMPEKATLGIFRKTSATGYAIYQNIYPIARTKLDNLSITPSAYPCISPPPQVCYQIGYFEYTIDLPKESLGYCISFQTCCRAVGITNMQTFPIPNTGTYSDGATYIATIPGTTTLGNMTNSSPEFLIKDTAIVCANNHFELNFGAMDPDGDSLSYSFCSAYDRGSSTSADEAQTPSAPPYNFITYTSGFSGNTPLGPNANIDPVKGLITGIAPDAGKYVVNVCIDEWRNSIKIGEHRKDFILEVRSCNLVSAMLDPSYITCDGYTLSFANLSNSPLVKTWFWDFGVTGTDTDSSTQEKPSYTFPTAGDYPIKLVVNRTGQCADSVTSLAKVYPGFYPAFKINGSCILNNFSFTDLTTTNYGTVDKWGWQFGDETTAADSSHLQNPLWKYSSTGLKPVTFVVGSSNGCLDTLIVDTAEVRDRPLITMPFRDTLICSVDTLTLHAAGLGTFAWTPDQPGISLLSNTDAPQVFPKNTTIFHITLDDNGCVSNDSVRVRVVDDVTLDAGPDQVICLTDPVTLNPSGDALYFAWSPTLTLDDPAKRNPVAIPTAASTTYTVKASISKKCFTSGFVTINTVPYPIANAGPDVTICYDDSIRLSGSMNGLSFTWTPAFSLKNVNSLTPLASPLHTTTYILSAYDNKGCPKPGRDTIIVKVRPQIFANAGNDTSVVSGQPLLLNASGAEFYSWTPPTGLNNPSLKTPVAILSDNMTYSVKAYTAEQCYAYDTINIKVFKTIPDIFVPNAFTPGRSVNNLFRPIPVGIAHLDLFYVYNRWGQLVYSGTDLKRGWDGKVAGKDQDAGTYVWMVKGTDYTGKVISRKGAMVLIR